MDFYLKNRRVLAIFSSILDVAFNNFQHLFMKILWLLCLYYNQLIKGLNVHINIGYKNLLEMGRKTTLKHSYSMRFE